MDVTLVPEHGLWPIGIITAIKEPVEDGIVRSATVRIASAGNPGDLKVPKALGDYKRNVRDMCKLPYYSEPLLDPPVEGMGEEIPQDGDELNFPDQDTGEKKGSCVPRGRVEPSTNGEVEQRTGGPVEDSAGSSDQAPSGQVSPVEGTGEKEDESHGGEQSKNVLRGRANDAKGAPPPERDKAVQKGVAPV
jgi:hypothetical protein